jgi:two-component system response regulator AtoC
LEVGEGFEILRPENDAMAAPTVRQSEEPPATDAAGADRRAGYFLVVLGVEHTLTQRLPTRGTLEVGRDEDADVRLVDALASRAHARLHVGDGLALEDLGSSNGTRLRDQRIPAHERVPLAPGDAIAIGTTLLVVQRHEPAIAARRLWPHGYFETRLIEACAQAETAKGTFAVLRLRVTGAAAEETLADALRPGDVLAAYGPDEYEVLLVDSDREGAEQVQGEVLMRLRGAGLEARSGLAFFPTDGIAPQALVSRASERLRPETPPAAVLIESAAMRELYAMAGKAARGMINVLVVGETGAGKEVLAETIHRLSPRREQPFVCINCAALADSLLESELFGYERGAFTGALQAKPGLLETASGGTLFLDEIGEMSLVLQAKILRAIETREVMRVGATRPRKVDVRFVAATNRDLEEEIAAGRFREDLFFRLDGITLAIPPLRERVEEIAPLATLFLERAARQAALPAPTVAPDALARLRVHQWPGNIRELRNVMERALLLSSGATITSEHLPVGKRQPPPMTPAVPTTMTEIERQAILDALVRCAGNQTRAAELLGIPRRTFCKRLSAYNIPRPRV